MIGILPAVALAVGSFHNHQVAVQAKPQPEIKAVQPVKTAHGSDSNCPTGEYLVLQTRRAVYDFLVRHRGQSKFSKLDEFMASVDPGKVTIIAIVEGPRENSMGVRFHSIDDLGPRIRVRFESLSFQTIGPGGGAIKANPWGVAILPRTTKPVVLEENVSGLLTRDPVWKPRAVGTVAPKP